MDMPEGFEASLADLNVVDLPGPFWFRQIDEVVALSLSAA